MVVFAPYDETVRYLNSILGAGWAEPGPDPACPAQTPSGEPPVEGPPPAMYAGMSSGPSALMVAWIALVALTYLDHSKAGGISR